MHFLDLKTYALLGEDPAPLLLKAGSEPDLVNDVYLQCETAVPFNNIRVHVFNPADGNSHFLPRTGADDEASAVLARALGMELDEAAATEFREAIATLPAVLEAVREAKKAARKVARKEVAKQTPFNGLLDWVRSNVGESDAMLIEQARGDTTDGLRAELKKAQARIKELETMA